MQCRVQRAAIWWVQSAGRMVQDAGRMQYQGAVCVQGARYMQVAGYSRIRSAEDEVEGAECRMEGGGCRVQDAP
jgi:hypothetical protein